MGRKTSEATSLKITPRGAMIWLRRSVKGEDCYYSSGYKNTPQNKTYLSKNGDAIFWQKYNEAHQINQDAYYTFNFRDFGLYALNISDGSRTKQKTKANTLAKFEVLCSYFGKYEITEITASRIEYWQTLWLNGQWSPDDKNQKPASKTIINYRGVLSLILKRAQKDEIIVNNPVELSDAPKVGKKIANTYNQADIAKILNACDQKFGDMIRFMVWTGMRHSELIALKWANVHLDLGYIVAKESMVEGEHGITKNGDERIITILPQLQEAVKRQMRQTAMRSEFVFLNQYNRPYVATKAIQTKFQKVCREAGVRIGEFYDLKRFFVTLMKQNKQPIDWLKQQVGHSAATTTDIYTGMILPDMEAINNIKAV
jgi:integrase